MSEKNQANREAGRLWEAPKFSKGLEAWINKLSRIPLQNWIDPRAYYLEAVDNLEDVNRDLVSDKTRVDLIREEFSCLNLSSLQSMDSQGYLLIELNESDYYLLKPFKTEFSNPERRLFVGKLFEKTECTQSSQLTYRTLFALFQMTETPINSSDPDTDYETQFLADGLTLLEESVTSLEPDTTNPTSTSLSYRYLQAGIPIDSAPLLKEIPPLSKIIETQTHLFTLQTDHHPSSTTTTTFQSTSLQPSTPSTAPTTETRSTFSSVTLTTTTAATGTTTPRNTNTKAGAPSTQTLDITTNNRQRVFVDEAVGKYAVREADGRGSACLQHGRLVYCGQLAPDLSLDGLGHLVAADPELTDFVQTSNESAAKTVWQGFFRQGRIVRGEMETSSWRYTGAFDEAGLPHGDGKVMFNNLDVYEGEMKHSRLEGFGKYTFFGGMKSYTGQFHLDKFHGKGCMRFHDGSIFLGDFDNGRPTNGTLKASLNQFDIRQELWQAHHRSFNSNPLLSPQNKMARISRVVIAKTKSQLTSKFTKGLQKTNSWWNSLTGKIESKEQPILSGIAPSTLDSDFESEQQPLFLYVYEGDFNEEFKAHGNGSIKDCFGNYYRGTFREGFKNGWGVFEFATGERYSGEFLDDQMHGRGRLVSADSTSEFVGGFRFGLFDGVGKFKQQGIVTIGVWEQGTLTQVISRVKATEHEQKQYGETTDSTKSLQPMLLCLPEPIYWPVLHRNYLSRSQLCHTSGRWSPIPQNDKSPKSLPPAFTPPALWTDSSLLLPNSKSLVRLTSSPSKLEFTGLKQIRSTLFKMRKWLLKLL